MIDLRHILDPGCTRTDVRAASKKSAFEQAAQLIAERNPDVDARRLLRELLARERLGSTGLGGGWRSPTAARNANDLSPRSCAWLNPSTSTRPTVVAST